MDLARLLIDFGILVMIWMVQLIVYPSFKYYTPRDLKTWHRRYTKRISIIVIPLMGAQLFLYSYALLQEPTIFNSICTSIVISLWLLTFIRFVPLHKAIETSKTTAEISESLVNRNWWRSLLWTVVFVYSLYNFLG